MKTDQIIALCFVCEKTSVSQKLRRNLKEARKQANRAMTMTIAVRTAQAFTKHITMCSIYYTNAVTTDEIK